MGKAHCKGSLHLAGILSSLNRIRQSSLKHFVSNSGGMPLTCRWSGWNQTGTMKLGTVSAISYISHLMFAFLPPKLDPQFYGAIFYQLVRLDGNFAQDVEIQVVILEPLRQMSTLIQSCRVAENESCQEITNNTFWLVVCCEN